MSKMMRKNLTPRSLWLISDPRSSRVEVLTVALGNGEALPVFSFEEEARMFLEFAAPDGGWRVRVTTVGELISVLSGPRSPRCSPFRQWNGAGWSVRGQRDNPNTMNVSFRRNPLP